MIGQVAEVHAPGMVAQQTLDRATVLVQGFQELEDPDETVSTDINLGVGGIGAHLALLSRRHRFGAVRPGDLASSLALVSEKISASRDFPQSYAETVHSGIRGAQRPYSPVTLTLN